MVKVEVNMEFKNIFTKKYIHPRDKETQNVEGEENMKVG